MANIAGLAGLYSGTSTQTITTLAGVTYHLAATADFTGVTYSRLDPSITYVGGVEAPLVGSNFPLNLLAGTTNLTLSDGTRVGAGGGFTFATDASRFAFGTYGAGSSAAFYVTVDGKLVDTASPTMPNTGSFPYVTVDLSGAGLSPGFHDIKVTFSGSGWVQNLTVPTGATVRAVADIGPRIVFLGDSFTEGTGAGTVQSGYVEIAGSLLGSADVWKSGFGGTGYEVPLNNRPALVTRIASDGVAAQADVYVVAMGLNDSDTSTTLRDSVTQTLATLTAGAPNAKVFVVDLWNPGVPLGDVKPVVAQTIRDVAAQFPGVVLLDPTAIPFTKSDPTHPDAAGHTVLADWLVAQIRNSLGADGVVEQNVAGDTIGPMFVDGIVAGHHYTYHVLENGADSSRFEVVDTGDAFPILKLKADQAIATTGHVELTVTVTDDANVTTSQLVGFDVRQHLVGTAGANVLQGTGNGVSIDAGDGNDRLVGTAGADLLIGGAGNDTLIGNGGTDKLVGGSGNDVYYVDSLDDIVVESLGEGNDTIYTALTTYALPDNVETLILLTGAVSAGGNELDNTIMGNDANNTLSGHGGNDRIYGGSGNDILYGGAGNDSLYGGSGQNSMAGGIGDDVYFIDNASDTVIENPGEGNDAVYTSVPTWTLGGNLESLVYTGGGAFAGYGNELDNIIRGGAGNDTLSGGGGNDSLYGGAGNDVLTGGAGNDFLYGGSGQNTMLGGAGNDFYYVDSVTDTIIENTGEGYDVVSTTLSAWTLGANIESLGYTGGGAFTGTGNALDNIIRGGAGNDTLIGGDGNDSLYGGAGNDVLSGGTGNDFLYGGAGQNTMLGGVGNDVYYVDSAGDTVTENPGEGTDAVYTSLSAWTLGANFESLVYTGAGNFSGNGNELANIVRGGNGDDAIAGGAGDDTIYGGAGNDTLIGGSGMDRLTGGAGADRFVFAAAADIAPGDAIVDFSHAEGDRIDLSAIAATSGVAFAWIGTDSFHGHAGDLRAQVVGGSTLIQADLDGDSNADFTLTLLGAITLSAGDFVL